MRCLLSCFLLAFAGIACAQSDARFAALERNAAAAIDAGRAPPGRRRWRISGWG